MLMDSSSPVYNKEKVIDTPNVRLPFAEICSINVGIYAYNIH